MQDGAAALPNALQVHRANFDDIACLFTLENSVASATSHTSNIQELGAIDHVVI